MPSTRKSAAARALDALWFIAERVRFAMLTLAAIIAMKLVFAIALPQV